MNDNTIPKVGDDWFDVEPIPISVKNRHLINITKPVELIVAEASRALPPVGVATVGSSLGRTYDLRGNPPNPKINTAPWLNSSIEPDTNVKKLE